MDSTSLLEQLLCLGVRQNWPSFTYTSCWIAPFSLAWWLVYAGKILRENKKSLGHKKGPNSQVSCIVHQNNIAGDSFSWHIPVDIMPLSLSSSCWELTPHISIEIGPWCKLFGLSTLQNKKWKCAVKHSALSHWMTKQQPPPPPIRK
jgi:hypothetical protein